MSLRSCLALTLMVVLPVAVRADWKATTALTGSAVRPLPAATLGKGTLVTSYISATNDLTLQLGTQALSADIQTATINIVPIGTSQVDGTGPASIDIAGLAGEIPPILGSANLFIFSPVTIKPSAALLAAFNEQRAYVTVGTTNFGGGEIRGNIIPEPASFSLVLLGFTSLACYHRYRIYRYGVHD